MNPASICEDLGLIPGLTQWIKDQALLWLWCMLAAATMIWPLSWKPPHAPGVALKKQKKKKNSDSTLENHLTPVSLFSNL